MRSIPTITARTWPRLGGSGQDLARLIGFGLVVLLIEIVLAHSAAAPQTSKLVLLFIGVFVVALLLRFPLATALLLVGFTDFAFGATYFAQQVGPVSVRPHEVALACLAVLAVVKPVKRTWGGRGGAALAVFLVLVCASAALAISAGRVELTEAFNWGRPLSALTLFYIVIRLFPEPEQRRTLLLGMAVIAAATGVIALLASVGAGFARNIAEQGEQVLRSEANLGSVDRVRLPGLSASYALFWYAAVQIMGRRGRQRLLWSTLMLGIAANILVSFNRNMWVGLVVGLLLITVVGGAHIRNRISIAIGIAVAAVAVLVVFGGSSSNEQIVEPVVKRGETLLNPSKTAGENSLQDRAKETSKAWATAQEHLLLGVGVGAPFGVNSSEPVVVAGRTIGYLPVPQLFLHNQYLYLLLIAGVPGLIAFVLFLGFAVWDAFTRRPRDRAILAIGIGIALIMVSSVVAIYFTVEDMTVVLGVLTGVVAADAASRAAASEPSGLL